MPDEFSQPSRLRHCRFNGALGVPFVPPRLAVKLRTGLDLYAPKY